jgi:hypothetical protein
VIVGTCPLRARCSPGGQRDIRIRRREDLRQAALQALSDPAERDHLKRTTPLIERLLGLIVHRYRGRKSRYRGARNQRSRPFGQPSSSTSTRSEPPCAPPRHKQQPTEGPNRHASSTPARRKRHAQAPLFSGLGRTQHRTGDWMDSRYGRSRAPA